MAAYKINISSTAGWFEVRLLNDAFWILPDNDDELSMDSENAKKFNVRFSKNLLLFSAEDGAHSKMTMYVETNEDKISFLSKTNDTITYSSDVDHFESSTFGGEVGVLRLS